MPRISPLTGFNPNRITWGTPKGDTPHIGRDKKWPGFVFQRVGPEQDPDGLTAVLTRLETHLPTPDYFFPDGLGLIAYQDMTDRRILIEPDRTGNRERLIDLMGRSIGYLATVGVGETFTPNAADTNSLGWGHPYGKHARAEAYLKLDPLPTIAAREPRGDVGPFAQSLDVITYTLDAINTRGITRQEREALADLRADLIQVAANPPADL